MSETPLMRDLMLQGQTLGLRLFRNQVGTYQLKDGRYLTSGLCVGSSDLIGYYPVVVTPEMVGRRIAVFVAVEVKTPGGRTEKTRAEQQERFLTAVKNAGAIGTIAHSVSELYAAVADWLGHA